jgi:peptide deformylase
MAEKLTLKVVHYPEPVLRKRAEEVGRVDEQVLETIASMFQTMYEDRGVGLAASQVGIGKRILVINPTGDPALKEEELARVDPVLIDRSGPAVRMEEGCLSFPGIFAEIERPDRCRVKALDSKGAVIELSLEGFTSRVVQHEYDHLEGVLLVDRMSPAEKVRHKAALEELVDEYKARRSKR